MLSKYYSFFLNIQDCRNDFESQLGRFVNAKPLETKVFSESWEKLDSMLEAVPKDTKIMTYCTGGIRCIKVTISVS